MGMNNILIDIKDKVEKAEKTAHCIIDERATQIYVKFDKREDVEISLFTPYAINQIKKGRIDSDILEDILFSVRRIANT